MRLESSRSILHFASQNHVGSELTQECCFSFSVFTLENACFTVSILKFPFWSPYSKKVAFSLCVVVMLVYVGGENEGKCLHLHQNTFLCKQCLNTCSQFFIINLIMSVYLHRGDLRYHYTHEIPCGEQSTFAGEMVPRDRRVSVICRTQPLTNT